MNKNKFITCALAAMMMASLAIPASAGYSADSSDENKGLLNDTTSYSNTTTVQLECTEEDIGPGTIGQYKITVPADINLETIDNSYTTDGGTKFTGTGDVTVSGTIGKQDKVVVNVTSGNDYVLEGEQFDVPYVMTRANDYKFSSTNTEVMTVEGSGQDDTNETVTLNFNDNGTNGVKQIDTYKDVLTFNYTYNGVKGDLNNFVYEENGSSEEQNGYTTAVTSANGAEINIVNGNISVDFAHSTYNIWPNAGEYHYVIMEDDTGTIYTEGRMDFESGNLIDSCVDNYSNIVNTPDGIVDFTIYLISEGSEQVVIDTFSIAE